MVHAVFVFFAVVAVLSAILCITQRQPVGAIMWLIVTMLALWEDDGATVSALGTRLHLDSGTLSPLLRRLADTGLVERRRDTVDERRVTVHLTPRGHEIRSDVAQVQHRLHASIDMTPDEVSTLRSLAHRFCDAAGTRDANA